MEKSLRTENSRENLSVKPQDHVRIRKDERPHLSSTPSSRMFIDGLLCTEYSARCWRYNGEQNLKTLPTLKELQEIREVRK